MTQYVSSGMLNHTYSVTDSDLLLLTKPEVRQHYIMAVSHSLGAGSPESQSVVMGMWSKYETTLD